MLQEASGSEYTGKLFTHVYNLKNPPRRKLLERADVYIASDLLYKDDIAECTGKAFAEFYLQGGLLIVTDPNRRGRQRFLETLIENVKLQIPTFDATFKDTSIPSWGLVTDDPFDGSSQAATVGMLVTSR